MKEKAKEIVIEGCEYSGKTSLISAIKEKDTLKPMKENGFFKQIFKSHWETWDKTKLIPNSIVIVLEASPLTLLTRAKENKATELNESDFFRERYLYRQLCAFFGNCHLIDTTTLSIPQLVEIVSSIMTQNNTDYIVPCIDDITPQQFGTYSKVIEGESKIIRQYNKRFQVIQYIASVHSHKQQRSGIVEGTDKERMRMTKNILEIFSRHSIKHSYFYIGKTYILNESLNPDTDLPPVEVIVKRCFVGTDTVRYYNIENINNRFGQPVVKKDHQNEYQNLLVRFDYRNPNYNPDTKQPMGDMVLCDDLADEFINTAIAKKTAKHIFQVLDHHFSKNNLYFEDVCFMLTIEGDKMYGEVSQDCGRYKYTKENELTDLDKDVWRRGGSFELVLEKYKMISDIIEKYVKTLYIN